MLGTRGIWHSGWFANTVHPPTTSGWRHFDQDTGHFSLCGEGINAGRDGGHPARETDDTRAGTALPPSLEASYAAVVTRLGVE